VAEFLSFSNPIPVFSISSQNPAKLFQSLSAINSLISVFSIQSCRLGGKILPAVANFCGRILPQNFRSRNFTSSLDIQT
jgi:hypothetical protein